MKLQRIGGFASIGTAILLVIALVIMLLVFPRLGLIGPGDWFDPVKGLRAQDASPITFFLFGLVNILWSITVVLVVLALRERMQAKAPNLVLIAVIGVSIASALWLSGGLMGIIGMPLIVAAKDASAYRAVMAVLFSLVGTGDHAMGWTLLLIGWAALRTRRLPRTLGYLPALKGICMILQFVVPPLMVIEMLLGIIFYPWLGIVLLRDES